MIILSPMEPWPGELVLDAASKHDVALISRVVDYGGIFHGDVKPGHQFPRYDHRGFRPEGWVERGWEKLQRMLPYDSARAHAASARLRLEPRPSRGRCVVPTLIQEAYPGARPIEEKRAELAALPAERRLSADDVAAIRAIGDNTGCMPLKGASPAHEGEERPDAWPLTSELAEVGTRWSIDPAQDLVATGA